jgi:2-dehydropantoate 2-reductase
MRLLIYGGGAVGLGIASCLLRWGCQVDIVGRQDTVDALTRDGLVRTGLFGRFHAPPGSFGAYVDLSPLASAPYDLVLACTKSFDSEGTAADLAEHWDRLGKPAGVVLFQNGWGNSEVFAARFDPKSVYSARVITGFRRHKPNEVEITVHADSIHIGSLFAADLRIIEPLCREIRQGGIPCEPTGRIGKDLWAKMLYNCALNPLGAILRVPYGALATQPTTRELMNRIIGEVFAVMEAAGYCTHWQRPGDFIEAFYNKLVPDTAEHESSMLQDITAGRRTEIDALNGAVMDLAQRHDLAVPYNQVVYDLVKFVEGTYL